MRRAQKFQTGWKTGQSQPQAPLQSTLSFPGTDKKQAQTKYQYTDNLILIKLMSWIFNE